MGCQLSIELKLLNAADLHNLLLNSGKCYASSLSLIWQSLFNLVLITFSACFFLIQISSRNIKRMLEEKNVWKSEGEGHFSPHEVLLCLLQYVCLFGEDLQGLSSPPSHEKQGEKGRGEREGKDIHKRSNERKDMKLTWGICQEG